MKPVRTRFQPALNGLSPEAPKCPGIGARNSTLARFASGMDSHGERKMNTMFQKPASGSVGWAVLLLLVTLTTMVARGEEAKPPVVVAKETLLVQIFTEHGVGQGTFVLREGKTGALTVHDSKRAATRFIPASTFKIPNSLIGLETG